jgi:hypothetical protein
VEETKKFSGPNGLPGKRWWEKFTNRWALKQSHFKRSNPKRPTKDEYIEWLNALALLIATHSIHPGRIYNADESGIDSRYGKQLVVAPGGVRDKPGR